MARSVVEVGDALARDWGDATYDVVLGNPPYLSQLAAATSRGGASARGGGPYADAAAEFLVLAVGLARPGGGRVGLLLPQSILGSRDAGPVRARVEQLPSRSGRGGRRGCTSTPRCSSAPSASSAAACLGNHTTTCGDRDPVWTGVITRAMGVPELPAIAAAGCVGDHVTSPPTSATSTTA